VKLSLPFCPTLLFMLPLPSVIPSGARNLSFFSARRTHGNRREIPRSARNERILYLFRATFDRALNLAKERIRYWETRAAIKKWSGPLRRVELDPEPPVKSGRPAPAFRLSLGEPKSAVGHAHGPSDSGTRRFSIGSKDRRVQHLRCRPTPNYILANPIREWREGAGKVALTNADLPIGGFIWETPIRRLAFPGALRSGTPTPQSRCVV